MPSKEEIRVALKMLDGSSADALESEVLEFKAWEEDARTLHKMLREHVVCLANARGGTIVLGVRDHVRTRKEAIRGVGQYDPQVLRRSIYDGTDPHILVEIEELVEPEGTLLLVHVPKGMPPHTTSDGVARIRIGKECKPLTGRTFAQLMASGSQQDPTAAVVPGAVDADLDPAEIEKLRSVLRREAQNEELARLSSGPLVAALGLASEEGVTLAGLLLLGKEEVLKRRVSQHEVVFLRFRGATRYDQRRDLKGPLLSLLGELEQLVSVNNRLVTVQEKNFGQLEFPDLSWEVAREAVLNAVTHRDYFLRQGVQVSLYRDRLEIVSPGGFVGGVTPKNVLRHPPIHRNELLARASQAAGLVDRVGLGVDRIFENLLRMGKEAPLYSADEAHVRLVVPLQTDTRFALFVAQEERSKARFELDDLLLLRRLTHAPTLDRWSASEVLQLPEEEVAARLAHLREAGYLVVRGRGRSATYDLRRDLADRLRGRAAVNADLPLAEEAVRLRVLALLKERGKLTNSEIRRFSGFSRTQVYRLVKGLEVEGKVRFTGGGRGAHLIPAGKAK